MSLFPYLQLQPIEPQEDGTVSDLDEFLHDDVIDLTQEEDGDFLIQEWDEITKDMHGASKKR